MTLLVWIRNFQAATLSTLDEFARAYPPMAGGLGDLGREFSRWCEDVAMDEVRAGRAAADGVERVARVIAGMANTAAVDFPEIAAELAFHAQQVRLVLHRYAEGLRKQAEWVPSPSAETKRLNEADTNRVPADTHTPMPRLLNDREVDELTDEIAREFADPFPTPDEPIDPVKLG